MRRSGTVMINPPTQEVVELENKEIEKGDVESYELDEIIEDEKKVLYEVSAVFPFQLFPDKVIIHPNKVVIVQKSLFFKNIFPILIRDLNTVTVSRGIIFASLKFEIRSYEENPAPVNFLWPENAGKAESIIIGLLSAVRDRGLNISRIPTKKAKRKMEKIGKTTEKLEEMF